MAATVHSAALSRPTPSQGVRGLRRALAEVRVTLSAMLRPGRLLAEVEQMRELHRRAAQLDDSDPAAAARLRARAARIGFD